MSSESWNTESLRQKPLFLFSCSLSIFLLLDAFSSSFQVEETPISADTLKAPIVSSAEDLTAESTPQPTNNHTLGTVNDIYLKLLVLGTLISVGVFTLELLRRLWLRLRESSGYTRIDQYLTELSQLHQREGNGPSDQNDDPTSGEDRLSFSLANLRRDFEPEDYEMLSQLDLGVNPASHESGLEEGSIRYVYAELRSAVCQNLCQLYCTNPNLHFPCPSVVRICYKP